MVEVLQHFIISYNNNNNNNNNNDNNNIFVILLKMCLLRAKGIKDFIFKT